MYTKYISRSEKKFMKKKIRNDRVDISTLSLKQAKDLYRQLQKLNDGNSEIFRYLKNKLQ